MPTHQDVGELRKQLHETKKVKDAALCRAEEYAVERDNLRKRLAEAEKRQTEFWANREELRRDRDAARQEAEAEKLNARASAATNAAATARAEKAEKAAEAARQELADTKVFDEKVCAENTTIAEALEVEKARADRAEALNRDCEELLSRSIRQSLREGGAMMDIDDANALLAKLRAAMPNDQPET